MSSGDEKSRENSPTSGPASRTSSRGSSRGPGSRRPPGPANIIEFVDSQDPNVKSAIQRHTAYHSAAQRREARLRSLRRGNQPRFLEWGRRPVSEPPAASPIEATRSVSASGALEGGASARTAPLSEAAALRDRESEQPLYSSAPGSRSISPQVPVTVEEELVLQRYEQSMCQPTQQDTLQPAITGFIRTDEACTQLLLAYCYAVSATGQQIQAAAEQELRLAQRYFGRGTNLLWNRLRDPRNASSDVNIQAVLLLVAYASDFGQGSEVDIHAEALRTMVRQRGGVSSISNAILRNQLASIESTRRYHLTLSFSHDCAMPIRFPGGFWPRS